MARVAIAAQRAVKAVAATVVQEQAKKAPGAAVDLTVCLDSGASGHLPSVDLAQAHGLTWDTSVQEHYGGASVTGGFTTLGRLNGKIPLEVKTVAHGTTTLPMGGHVAPVGQSLASTPAFVRELNLFVVDCLNSTGGRGSFALDPDGRQIPLPAARNNLTVLPIVGGPTP